MAVARGPGAPTLTPRMAVLADELAEEIARCVVEAMHRVGSGKHPGAMGEVGRRAAIQYALACAKAVSTRIPQVVERQARASDSLIKAYVWALDHPNKETGI